jgi:hypothetical protein
MNITGTGKSIEVSIQGERVIVRDYGRYPARKSGGRCF